MTGKQRNDSLSFDHDIPPAKESIVLIKKALAGVPFTDSDEKRIARQLAQADQNLSQHTRSKRTNFVTDAYNQYTKMVKTKRLPPSEEDFYDYLFKCMNDESCPLDPKAKKPKVGMSLPKDEVTQMRNRAKKGGTTVIVQRPKQKAKQKKKRRTTNRSTGMAVYSAPASLGTEFVNDFPKRIRRGDNSMRIHYREPVGQLLCTTDFSNAWVNANPGDYTIFPWLSKIASAYEKYKWHSLRFWYAASASSQTAGAGFFYPDYDPNDDHSTSVTKAMENQNAMQFSPWKSCRGPELITPDLRKATPLLIYKGAMKNTNLGNDYPLYNFLSTWFSFQGGDDSTESGIVYMEYDVELFHETGENAGGNIIVNTGSDATTAKPVGASLTNMSSILSKPVFGTSFNSNLLQNNSLNGLKYNSSAPSVINPTNQGTYLQDEFAGLIVIDISGNMTGNVGTTQISITRLYGEATIGTGRVLTNSSNRRVEAYPVYANTGALLQFALVLGLVIAITATTKVSFLQGDSEGGTSSRGYLAAQAFCT